MAKLKGQTTSRVIELGVIIHISATDVTEALDFPAVHDEICIIVCSEEIPGTVKEATELSLLISLDSGSLLAMEPVPAGHPAHGEFSTLGEPTTVWKIARITEQIGPE
jgi:hypothetical protein